MKMTVSKKLYSGFFAILLLLAGIASISYYQMSTIDKSYGDLIDNRAYKVSLTKDMLLAVRDEQIMIRSYLLIGDDKYIQNWETAKEQFKKNSAKLNKIVVSAEGVQYLSQLDQLESQYNQIGSQSIQLKKQNNLDEALKISETQAGPVVDKITQAAKNLIQLQQDVLDKGNEDNSKKVNSTLFWLLTLSILAVIAGIGVAFYISRQISLPIMEVAKSAERIANGDLTGDSLSIKNRDEIGDMAIAFNKMSASITAIISTVLISSQNLSAAAQQISASTEEIASGSANQASSAQTIHELFRELSVAITSVANGAEQAAELSNNTMDLAQEGGKVLRSSIEGMNLANEQMARLEEDSNKIGEIIEVIDDIADQTNLLALNAAIEAARAGDQGRGFAVVADEVRKLAERSSEATKQITAIIKGMQKNTLLSISAVNQGVVSSQKTGESFESIVYMVNDSANKVSEIAAASEQQAAQTSEVLLSIESISAATEEAAASSEETASAAQSLAMLAEELNIAVEMFKIK